MRLLLDTHALIWWVNDDPKLGQAASAAIRDPANIIHVSAVSAMEIATKYRLGKLDEAALLARDFEREVEAEGFVETPVTWRHARLAGSLDIAHKDPFDRLLIAQALVDDLILVSNESVFDGFGVSRLW